MAADRKQRVRRATASKLALDMDMEVICVCAHVCVCVSTTNSPSITDHWEHAGQRTQKGKIKSASYHAGLNFKGGGGKRCNYVCDVMESNITNNLRNDFWHESMKLRTNKEQRVMRNAFVINEGTSKQHRPTVQPSESSSTQTQSPSK